MVVFLSCITGVSTVVLVLELELRSITCPDLSSLDEQPTMVANRTTMTRYNGAAIVFLFMTVNPLEMIVVESNSPGEFFLVQHPACFKFYAKMRMPCRSSSSL